jgi:hypothetical protein
MGHLDESTMQKVDRAIAVSVGLGDWQPAEHVMTAPTPAAPAAVVPPSSAPVEAPAPAVAAAISDAPVAGIGDVPAVQM